MLRIRTGSGSSTLAHPWKIFVVVFAGLVHDGRAGDGEVQALQVRPVAREPQPRTVLQEVQERHHHPVPLRQQPHWRVHQLAQGKKDTITQYLFANNLIDECISWLKVSSVSDPYSLNPDPDPAKNLHPDPEDPWIRIRSAEGYGALFRVLRSRPLFWWLRFSPVWRRRFRLLPQL